MNSDAHSQANTARRHLLACALLVVLTAAVFGQALTFDFVGYDDPETVTDNPHIRDGITFESLRWALTSFQYFANWFPVTWFSHMLDIELFGMNPAGHHATSLLLHALNVLLLYGVLFAMTRAFGCSLVVAALFAVHPLHVETAVWISERKGVLSTTFWLLAMAAYLRYVHAPSAARYALVAMLLVLGLVSKPMLVTLPFVFVLLDYWPLKRITCRTTARRYLVEKIPLFVCVAILSAVFVGTQQRGGALKSVDQYPPIVRAENALASYLDYLEKTFWPVDLTMLYPHPGADLPAAKWIVATIILVVLSAIALWQVRRRPYVFVGWFWFVGTLVPASQIVQVGGHAMADRYVYVPHIGLFIALVWSIAEFARERSVPRSVLATISAVIVLAAAALSVRQAQYWRDGLTLYTHAVAVTDNNHIVHNNLGRTLVDLGRVDEAIAHYKEALRIEPDELRARINYGNALAAQRRWTEAAEQFVRAVEIDPDYAPARTNFGNVLMQLARFDDALVQFQSAVALEPKSAEIRNSLGACYFQMARYDEAIDAFSEALELNPNYAKAARNLAAARAKLGTSTP